MRGDRRDPTTVGGSRSADEDKGSIPGLWRAPRGGGGEEEQSSAGTFSEAGGESAASSRDSGSAPSKGFLTEPPTASAAGNKFPCAYCGGKQHSVNKCFRKRAEDAEKALSA